MRQDKDEEALQFMAKAVGSESKNHMAHFYYAELLQRMAISGADGDRRQRLQLMRTHLKKSIDLAPDFTAAYRWLGYVALSLNEELADTETALGKALKVAPGNEDLRFTLAEVMALNKKEAAARVLLTSIRNTTTDEVMRTRSSNLIEKINARLESAAAMRDYEERRKAAGLAEETALSTGSTDEGPPTVTRNTNAPSEPGSRVFVAESPQQSKGPQVEGYLTLIDCSKGMDLQVRVGNGIVRLHTETPSSIDFVSYVTEVKDSIGCGPVKPERHVVITYKRSTDPAFLGIPLIVEFKP